MIPYLRVVKEIPVISSKNKPNTKAQVYLAD